MGCEANIDSIRALEKQIEEGNGDLTELKRARNSLLNVSTRVPPEVLGYIFVWSLIMETGQVDLWRLEGLQKGSYNFLLVCHHWFEVASRTPELWTSWGTTLQDWKKCHRRRVAAAPLNLVLHGGESNPDLLFDEPLQDAVKSRVRQDTICRVHLMPNDCDTLASIISSLTPDHEGCQNENIESIMLRNRGSTFVDVSDFFARSRLPRLHFLDLYGRIQISPWDRLAPRTTLLTALSLDITIPPPSPTLPASQLFSILSSNPNLQELSLADAALPDDADSMSFKVQLPQLNTLSLTGKPYHLLGLLRQLILPETLDDMDLTGYGSTVEVMSQVLAPYMQDYFRRNPRFQGRLGLYFSCDDSISISVGVVYAQTPMQLQEPPRVSLTALTDLPPPLEQLFSLIALIPREQVVRIDVDLEVEPPEELFLMMPNIEALRFSDLELFEGFLKPNPRGPHANTKLLPSLETLCLQDPVLEYDDWSPLTAYLAHQTSDGQTISLAIFGDVPDMPPEVVNEIKGRVKEFTYRRDSEEGEGE